jgi:hypothetical protein
VHTNQITAVLPTDVAQDLMDAGIAARIPTTRTGVPLADIIVTGLSVATTVVTLAQAPATLDDVAHRLLTWRRQAKLRRDPVVSVDASGPNGRISLQLTSTTSEEEIAHAVSLVLAGSPVGDSAQTASSSLPETETET